MNIKKLKERLGEMCPDKILRLHSANSEPVVGISLDYNKGTITLESKKDSFECRPYKVRDLLDSLEGEDELFRVLDNTGKEILFAVEEEIEPFPTSVWFENEQDTDLFEVLPTIFEKALDEQDDELNFYMGLLETGITVPMVSMYLDKEHALHMELFCVEHRLLDERERTELVFLSQTEDVYVLRNSLGNICTDEEGIPFSISHEDIKKCLAKYPCLEEEGAVNRLARSLCFKNNLFLIDEDTMEELNDFGFRILYDEDLINLFLGEEQTFFDEEWADGKKKTQYLKCIEYGLDLFDANRYVHCCDLFSTTLDFGYSFKICDVLEKNGYDIFDVVKTPDNRAWQVLKENIFWGNDNSIYTFDNVKEYYSKHSFVCYNDKDFYEWLENQEIFKKLA